MNVLPDTLECMECSKEFNTYTNDIGFVYEQPGWIFGEILLCFNCFGKLAVISANVVDNNLSIL